MTSCARCLKNLTKEDYVSAINSCLRVGHSLESATHLLSDSPPECCLCEAHQHNLVDAGGPSISVNSDQ